MERREFLENTLAGGVALSTNAGGPTAKPTNPVGDSAPRDVVIERAASGKPHAGKVLATIAPHSRRPLDPGRRHDRQADRRGLHRLPDPHQQRREGFVRPEPGPDRGRQRSRQRGHGQGAGHQAGVRSGLSQPPHGRRLARRDAGPADLSDSAAEDRHDLQLRPLGPLRGEPRPLRDGPVRRGGLLDGRRASGFSRALCRRAQAALGERKILLRPRTASWSIAWSTSASTIDKKMAAIRANRTMIGNMVREFRDELARRKLKLPELEKATRGGDSRVCRPAVSRRPRPAAARSTAWSTPSSFTTSGPTRRSTSISPSTRCRRSEGDRLEAGEDTWRGVDLLADGEDSDDAPPHPALTHEGRGCRA